MTEPTTVTSIAVLIVTLIGGFWANLNGLKDLKTEVKDLRDNMNAEFKSVRSEVKDLRDNMNAEFKSVRSEVNAEFKSARSETNAGFLALKEESVSIRVNQALQEYRLSRVEKE